MLNSERRLLESLGRYRLDDRGGRLVLRRGGAQRAVRRRTLTRLALRLRAALGRCEAGQW